MSTKSGPYEVVVHPTEPSEELWWYQHDMMGDNFEGDVFYVKGPSIYIEIPMDFWRGAPGTLARGDLARLLPQEVLVWLDAWPKTPECNP